MPGRPDFSTPGTKGTTEKITTIDRPEIEVVEINRTSSLAAGTAENIEIYAPTGSTYEVVGMFVQNLGDADATSGDKILEIKSAGSVQMVQATQTAGGNLQYKYGSWNAASVSPSDQSAMVQQIQGLQATENSPISFRLDNRLDVALETGRSIKLSVMEREY